jgi:hypothetical protein
LQEALLMHVLLPHVGVPWFDPSAARTFGSQESEKVWVMACFFV